MTEDATLEGRETHATQVHRLTTAVDAELLRLSQQGAATATLVASWSALVELLAIAPAPQSRPCPSCGSNCMLAAIRCGHCWAALSPGNSATGEASWSRTAGATTVDSARGAARKGMALVIGVFVLVGVVWWLSSLKILSTVLP